MLKITLNGQTYEAPPGKKIIEVADEVGVHIPRYCYHPDIGVEGSCRMCLVEVEKAPKLAPSCATPIADGMVVRTNTERVQQAVRYAMEFLLLHHPIDCPVCALTSTDFRFKVRAWFLQGTNSVCGGCSTGCNLRVDHSARAIGGGIPGYTASEGKIYRTVGRRNVDVNKSWLCDEGRLSFHTVERWPRLRHASMGGAQKFVGDALLTIHEKFESIRKEHGDASVAAIGSATNTNEALFLM